MDSSKDITTVRNPVKLDSDTESNSHYRNSASNLRQRNSPENLHPSTSNQRPSIVLLNGQQWNHMNSLTGNEPTPQTSRCNEITSEKSKISSNVNQQQSQICHNKVTNNETDSVAGTAPNLYDNGTESQGDTSSCQRHKNFLDKIGSNTNNIPSTSSTSSEKAVDNQENSHFRENRKRPSSLKLNRIEDDSSSDTGNDDYSLGSEDGCIYTYRGGEHLADLPSSFFSLDMGLPLDNHLPLLNYPVPQAGAAPLREQGSRASSPDMEFLEMDFDPGPSCEVDSGDESSPDVDLEIAGNMVEEIEPVLIRGISPEYVPSVPRHNPVTVATSAASGLHTENSNLHTYNVPSTSRVAVSAANDISESTTSYSFGPYITHINSRGEELLVRRTMAHGHMNVPISLHITSGDLVTPREMLNLDEEPHGYQINQGSTLDSVNLSSTLYHITMAKKLTAEKNKFEAEAQVVVKSGESSGSVPLVGTSTSSAGCVEAPRCMIWSEIEACERQVTQIATSACGATAVVNVFNALGVPVNLERINTAVGTRQRANNAPIPRYLLSRAIAGCTAADLVSGIHRASDGLVTARFFPTYPERAVSLSYFLADWITLGAVPILTLNLQAGCDGEMPDAWHHQMVFGVSSRRIYLCNPVESIRENVLWPRLISPSVLLVRSRDILSRFTAETDLSPLTAVPDPRFHAFNVLGQVANVIREYRAMGWGDYGTRTRYIRIPASYQAGITVAALTGSEAHRRLVSAPQLPIISSSSEQ